jgi:ABC-type transporter Mla MlaB component
MINNTNFAHWNRLQAKSLDAQFVNEMITGLNCSPFEADAIIEKVHEVFSPLFETSQGIKPGQIQVSIVDASVAPNVPLARAKQRLVTLTLHAGQEDIETRKKGSVPALRQKRMCRMCQEAFQQGGLLTLEDLANLFNCGVRTLINDLADLRKINIVPSLRSTTKDMGRAITHRRLIISLWLQGFEYSEIAHKASHSVDSVGNYVDKFKRCAALFVSGVDVHAVALMVKLSTPLTQEFQRIHADLQGVPHRLRELEEFFKKNRVPSLKRRNRL